MSLAWQRILSAWRSESSLLRSVLVIAVLLITFSLIAEEVMEGETLALARPLVWSAEGSSELHCPSIGDELIEWTGGDVASWPRLGRANHAAKFPPSGAKQQTTKARD